MQSPRLGDAGVRVREDGSYYMCVHITSSWWVCKQCEGTCRTVINVSTKGASPWGYTQMMGCLWGANVPGHS